MNKVCIYGVGAVGGFIGALLAHQGSDVSVVSRGATLSSVKADGVRLLMDDEIIVAPVRASDNPRDLGVQDLVIVAVKAQSMTDVAAKISPLIGPQTVVLTAMNGVPWWFFQRPGAEFEGMQLESVDPGGKIAAAIPADRVIGAVVHGSFTSNGLGFSRNNLGKKLIVGEPDGSDSKRLKALDTLLSKAGIEIETTASIQQEIWYKLWGNMTMNPVSALTGVTCDKILDDPLVNRFCLKIMAEAGEIGARIGCPISQTGEERNAVTRQLGAFKTSMLQDVEAGRSLELNALVAAVREIGQKVGIATPEIDTLLGLSRLHARRRDCIPMRFHNVNSTESVNELPANVRAHTLLLSVQSRV
ncbi:2-dehydropantoate 2-reductase [Desulfuromonas acetoxidans]|nr:2-dehydropantoate 2-reductase [Desulfuromonas acetoxidans]NVD23819.1 2-dehydropantoate 2-reductase [Desulfuromonas acetoxidans]NVE15784.1 2-dehydropantoate 2-reductase [Desulfuromonas acetoxidans]